MWVYNSLNRLNPWISFIFMWNVIALTFLRERERISMFVRDPWKVPIFLRESILQWGIEDPHYVKSIECMQISIKINEVQFSVNV